MQITKTGDYVEIRRAGFPVDIETGPAPFEPWRLPHMGNRPNDADADDEQLAAQAEGARMAMGDQAPSEPMPLVILRRHLPDQEVGEMWANAACVVGAIAAIALFVHWLGGGKL